MRPLGLDGEGWRRSRRDNDHFCYRGRVCLVACVALGLDGEGWRRASARSRAGRRTRRARRDDNDNDNDGENDNDHYYYRGRVRPESSRARVKRRKRDVMMMMMMMKMVMTMITKPIIVTRLEPGRCPNGLGRRDCAQGRSPPYRRNRTARRAKPNAQARPPPATPATVISPDFPLESSISRMRKLQSPKPPRIRRRPHPPP